MQRRQHPGAFSLWPRRNLSLDDRAASPMPDLAVLALAPRFAGFVDAIVGGGGLILVPALFSVYPNAAPAMLFGTNKGAAVWGTAFATAQFRPPRGAGLGRTAAGRARGLRGRPGRRLGRDAGQRAGAAQGLALRAARRARLHAGAQGDGPSARARASQGVPRRWWRAHWPGDRVLRRLLRPRHRQLLRLPVRAPAGLRLPARQRQRQAAQHRRPTWPRSPCSAGRATSGGISPP